MFTPSILNRGSVDDFFDDMFRFPREYGRGIADTSKWMHTDVKEFDDRYQLELALAGFGKEDVKVSLKNGYLYVQASKEEKKEEKNQEGKFLRREIYSGKMERSFYVGNQVKQEDVHGKFENGILKLEVPKVSKAVEEEQYISIEG